MPIRMLLLGLALTLQAGCVMVWIWAWLRRGRQDMGPAPTHPSGHETSPALDAPAGVGRLARRFGLAGGAVGLAYAVQAGDPVFFVGQALAMMLAWRSPMDADHFARNGPCGAPRVRHTMTGRAGGDHG